MLYAMLYGHANGSWLMYDDLTDVIKPNTIQPNTIQYNLTLPYTIHHNTVGVHEP